MYKLFIPSRGKISPYYMKYMGWSFVSNVLVSMQVAMTTHSMLDVVADTNATSGIRTMNYIGKDVIGQLGSLVYMSRMGVLSDKEPKGFSIKSGVLQQMSFGLMSITPMIGSDLFLPLAGSANLLSNISFTGYGAINAKCIQEMSDDNIGEIYARLTTVNTLASSLGLGLGIWTCYLVPCHETRACFIPLIGLVRIYTFDKAIEDIITK
jgi:hypothetical protein